VGPTAEGRTLNACEACGTECPESAAYCGTCGHRLGRQPEEPVAVNVHVVSPWWDGCIGCFSWAVASVVIIALVGWIFSC
jgi:hypothetical protein